MYTPKSKPVTNVRFIKVDSGHERPLKIRIYERPITPNKDFYNETYYNDGPGTLTGDTKSGYQNYEYTNAHVWQAREIVGKMHPNTSLDVGCATGPLVLGLKLFGVKATGIDISEWAVTHPCMPNMELDLHQGSITNLPFRDKEFDVVTCLDMLEHLPTLEAVEKAVSELCRVSNKYVWMATPFDNDDGKWNFDASHFFFAEKRFWIWEFSRHKFLESSVSINRTTNDYGDDIIFERL